MSPAVVVRETTPGALIAAMGILTGLVSEILPMVVWAASDVVAATLVALMLPAALRLMLDPDSGWAAAESVPPVLFSVRGLMPVLMPPVLTLRLPLEIKLKGASAPRVTVKSALPVWLI